MKIDGKVIGIGITGSFCTFYKMIEEIERLKQGGARIVPIFSEQVQHCDTRFGKAEDLMEQVEAVAGQRGIRTIPEAEPIGPGGYLDALAIIPCTGNTLAKLANGITDGPVLMAAKAHLRNGKPLIISISSNDALGMNMKNIGLLMNMKQIYFVPFGQDNCEKKPNSMIARVELLEDTIEMALDGVQIQPVIQKL